MEDRGFLYFIFGYYHSDLVYELLTDDAIGNDYATFREVKALVEEFLAGDYDNEDEDIEDTTRAFLLKKIQES